MTQVIKYMMALDVSKLTFVIYLKFVFRFLELFEGTTDFMYRH